MQHVLDQKTATKSEQSQGAVSPVVAIRQLELMIVRAMLMVVIVTLFFSGMTTDLIKIIFKEIFGGCRRTTEQCVVPQH